MTDNALFNSRFIQSMRCALRGFRYAVISQRNMGIHIFCGFLATILGVWIGLSRFEWMYLLITITIVLILEMLNTSIEIAIDLVTKKRRYRAMLSKDIAAGAVLLASIHAVIAGGVIFYDKIIQKLG